MIPVYLNPVRHSPKIMSCCGGGGSSGRWYGRPFTPGFTTAGTTSCCGGCAPRPCGPPSCATTALSTYQEGATLSFTNLISSAVLAPSLTVNAGCTVATSIVFSGTLQLLNTADVDLANTVDVYIQYYNTLLPSSPQSTVVPVRTSLVAAAEENGPYIPVTASLDVTLPAGTYVVQVNLQCTTTDPVDVLVSGTLNAVVTKSTTGY